MNILFTEFFKDAIDGFYLLEIDNGSSIDIIQFLRIEGEDDDFIYTLSLDNKDRFLMGCFPKKRIISIKQKHN